MWRGEQHDAVGGLQAGVDEIDGIARRRMRDRRVFGLILVEER